MTEKHYTSNSIERGSNPEKKITELSMQEATRLLHNFFAFSHGNNGLLKHGEVIYRNAHGQHKLPENFADPDSAPKVIANYASNSKTHTLINDDEILETAVNEARYFQSVMQSPHELTSYDIWRHAGRSDLSKPFFSEPEFETVCLILDHDGSKLKKNRKPVILPLVLDPTPMQKMGATYETLIAVRGELPRVLKLLEEMVENESLEDEERNKAYDYIKLYRKISSAV